MYEFHPLGDQAILIEFGKEMNLEVYEGVQYVSTLLDEFQPEWLIEYVPAYTTLTIFYNPLVLKEKQVDSRWLPYDVICQEIASLLALKKTVQQEDNRTVEIPVCYGGEWGPDLSYVADYNGLTEEEVIHIHSKGTYIVYMLGFAPGFPYIGGMSSKIATPRRSSPRLKIPSRSVGIAGSQTGIYPIETPGGWQVIGSTPLQLFTINQSPPTLLRAGDRITFKPINDEEYRYLEER